MRVKFGNFVPEFRRVIHMPGVAQFVYNYVINQLKWQVHHPDVQANRPRRGATSPAT